MDEVMRVYFERIKEEGFPRKGELSDYDIKIEGEGCKGAGSSDDIVFYIKKKEDIIEKITYVCNYCIPPSYIASDIICRFAEGKSLKEVKAMSPDDINTILGGESPRVYELISDLLKVFPEE